MSCAFWSPSPRLRLRRGGEEATDLKALKAIDPDLEVRFSSSGDLERIWFSSPLICVHGSIPKFLDWFESHLWPNLARLLGVGPDDSFDLRVEPVGIAGQIWGYRMVYHRLFRGIPVPHDELRLHLTLEDGPQVSLSEDSLLVIKGPEKPEKIRFTGGKFP